MPFRTSLSYLAHVLVAFPSPSHSTLAMAKQAPNPSDFALPSEDKATRKMFLWDRHIARMAEVWKDSWKLCCNAASLAGYGLEGFLKSFKRGWLFVCQTNYVIVVPSLSPLGSWLRVTYSPNSIQALYTWGYILIMKRICDYISPNRYMRKIQFPKPPIYCLYLYQGLLFMRQWSSNL